MRIQNLRLIMVTIVYRSEGRQGKTALLMRTLNTFSTLIEKSEAMVVALRWMGDEKCDSSASFSEMTFHLAGKRRRLPIVIPSRGLGINNPATNNNRKRSDDQTSVYGNCYR